MKEVTPGQKLEVALAMVNRVDWQAIDGDILQREVIAKPDNLGRQATIFLQNRAMVIVGEPIIIHLDRSRPFDPTKFIGQGWTIWRGPKDGNGLEGEEEQDRRSLALTELNLSQVRFENCLKPDEIFHTGEERLTRLLAQGGIRLDVGVFWHLWQNKHLIPASWKEPINGNTRFVFFDGTTLRDSDGNRYALCLYWNGVEWLWFVYWRVDDRHADGPSVVLAS